jgi:hypothetical protein
MSCYRFLGQCLVSILGYCDALNFHRFTEDRKSAKTFMRVKCLLNLYFVI